MHNGWRVVLAGVAMMVAANAQGADARGTAGQRAFAAVDPFIGTGGEGHTFPGATVPFGMVQLSPDTRIQPRKDAYGWAAGYRYSDTTIVGFSHTHFSGTGHSDLGDVLLMPVAGDVTLERGDPDRSGSGYTSRFSHASERAEPGYYAVTLDDAGVRAELTASARVGVHRYAFAPGKPAHVLLDLRTSMYDYPGKVLWSRIRVRADGTVTGFRETRGWAPGRQLYFAMRFSQPLVGHALHNTETDIAYKGFPPPGEKDPTRRAQIEGRQLVASLDFGGGLTAPLIAKVAISSVDEAMVEEEVFEFYQPDDTLRLADIIADSQHPDAATIAEQEELVDRSSEFAFAFDLLKDMPRLWRRIFLLIRVDGLDASSVSEILLIPSKEDTVQRWLMQAEAFIAAHLEEAGVSKNGNDWLQGVDWSALSVTRSAAASLWSKEANHEE